ncbi:major royal jelly protein [Colletotrichum karsti]|uniref:fumarylacetoacetase n=1 Tax=Colletotrichum karsti TaxID=1095194 RepID=A0A9P6I2P7_9PEZI|nr:major royal jelly protein [Colletotrichum karsti]KAF9874715.1 major royal jelly protein [Colletotrichum karsti]
MPLWLVYHTPDTFVDVESRRAFVKDITAMYTSIGLPAFYVIVNFLPMSAGSMWKGNEIPEKPFVRLSMDHIAVHLENDVDNYRATCDALEKLMKPHIADKGYDYEYHVDETERELWRINGVIPPPWGSKAEKKWFEANAVVPYELEDGESVSQKLHNSKEKAKRLAAEANKDKPLHRPAVAIGDHVLDLDEFAKAGGFRKASGVSPEHLTVFSQPTLNSFAELGRPIHRIVRSYLQEVLQENTPHPYILKDNQALQKTALRPVSEVTLHLPFAIGDYTDFFAGRNHAHNVGTLFRGAANAMQPNYNHLPVAYHGRASSVVVSGTPLRRPWGQALPAPGATEPVFRPCARLDIELEMGMFICRPNGLGNPVSVKDADEFIFGYVLMNDWSARDIQQWEYVPLGPFNAKNFGTTISPWVVLADALEPFRTKGLENNVQLQNYLREDRTENVLDIKLEVSLSGITVSSTGRKFSNYPGGLDSNNTNNGNNGKYTVAELFDDNTERPYPSADFNNPPGGSINFTTVPPTGANYENYLIGVQSVVIDSADRLWILDTGRVLTADGVLVPASVGGPKLIGIDLNTNSVIKTIVFPDTVAYPVSYLNDVRFDLSPSLTSSGQGVAYITDSSSEGRTGLITVDLGSGESWRHLGGSPYVQGDRQFLAFIWGQALYANQPGSPAAFVTFGVDGIALGADGKDLYFGGVGNRYLYSIPTQRLLDNGPTSEARAQASVVTASQKGLADGFETDTNGFIYHGNFEQNAVNFFNPANGTDQVFLRDPRINWADTFSVATDGYIYFTNNQLGFGPQIYPGTDRRQRPFSLFRAKLPNGGAKVGGSSNSTNSRSR